MSQILPIAPPPPLPLALAAVAPHKLKLGSPLSSCTPIKQLQIDACLWALEYPELQKACYLARTCQINPPLQCQYRQVTGILQEGPTCGLTALSMLLNGSPTSQHLLAEARKKNYTNNGEMFSAFNLFDLVRDHLQKFIERNNPKTAVNDNAELSRAIECELHEGRLNCAKVRDCLLAGACLLVPYDPDYNHAPCLKLGHKAHWALIVGYLIDDEKEFFVLARHGKAKNLALWSFQALSESNANLLEFAQPKGYPDCDFLVPAGGIGGVAGLNERAIIVQGLPQSIITVP